MIFFIPQAGTKIKLLDDWKVEVSWVRSNLVWLKEFGWTGTSPSKWDTRYNKKTGEHVQTVPNPLFKMEDGRWRPALCIVPKDTILEISRYEVGYEAISIVHIKCIECPSKNKLKGKNISVGVEKINFNGDIIDDSKNISC
jgi:hypothetical protein